MRQSHCKQNNLSSITQIIVGMAMVALLIGMVVPAWGAKLDVILEWNAVALQVNVIDHSGVDTPGNL